MRLINKCLLALMLVGVAAALGVWWWKHHQVSSTFLSMSQTDITVSPQERQVANATSAERYTSEWARRQAARNNAADAESATRAFKEANDCLVYHGAQHELNAILNDERLKDLSKQTLATLGDIDTTSGRYLSIVRKTEALCRGSNEDALARAYIDAILTAALLGNPDAQTCFVIGSLTPTRAMSASAEWSKLLVDRYLKYAPVFTQNALERGDPYVAARALYRYGQSPGVDYSRVDDMPRADPYLTWRMARLASLRALPDQRTRLEVYLASFQKKSRLQPGDIKRADAWAKATYEREFAGQPPINLDSHAPCYSSPDLAP